MRGEFDLSFPTVSDFISTEHFRHPWKQTLTGVERDR